jgi:hypothetical protein
MVGPLELGPLHFQLMSPIGTLRRFASAHDTSAVGCKADSGKTNVAMSFRIVTPRYPIAFATIETGKGEIQLLIVNIKRSVISELVLTVVEERFAEQLLCLG